MLNVRLARFKGSSRQVSPYHPMQKIPLSGMQGIPLGRDAYQNRVYNLDPLLSLRLQHTNALTFLLIADIEFGKSFIAKLVVSRLWSLSNDGRHLRTMVMDGKGNDGDPEWRKTLLMLRCKEVHAANWQINILDKHMKMTFQEQLSLIILFVNHLGVTPMNDLQEKALTVVLANVLKTSDPHLRLLVENLAMPKVAAQRAAAKWGIDPATLRQEARMSGLRLEKLLGNQYGNMFNGRGSLKQVMSQTTVGIDFNGLPEHIRILLLVSLSAWKNSARLRNDPELMFDMEIHDEAWDNMKYPVWLASIVDTMKKCRDKGTIFFMLMHRVSDLMATGGTAADNLIGDVANLIIGHQPPSELPVLREKFNLPEAVLLSLPHLEQGQFWFIIGHLDPVLVNIMATPQEIENNETNSSTKRKVGNRYDLRGR